MVRIKGAPSRGPLHLLLDLFFSSSSSPVTMRARNCFLLAQGRKEESAWHSRGALCYLGRSLWPTNQWAPFPIGTTHCRPLTYIDRQTHLAKLNPSKRKVLEDFATLDQEAAMGPR